MKLGLFAAAVLVAASLTSAASAQTTTPSAHQRALASQLIDVMHIQTMMNAVSGMVQKSMMGSLTANLPAAERDKSEAMTQASQEEMKALTPKLMDFMVDVYANEFTEKELNDSIAFYKSESGQSILAKTPALAARMGPFMVTQMPQIMQGMYTRYCAKVTCTAEETAKLKKTVEAMTSKPAV